MERDLVLIALALLTWGIGEGAYFYFQPLYLQELGASPVAIGSILGAVAMAMSLAHIPVGYFADRIGRRGMLRAAWLMGLTATWIMALAPGLPLFVAGMLLYGLTAAVMSPLNSYITAARGRLSVGRALTVVSAAYNSGAFFGPLIGGAIGQNFALRHIYLFAGSVFIVSTLVMFFIRPQPVEPRDGVSSRDLLHNRAYLGFLALTFIVMFALYLPQPLTPNFLQNQRGLDLTRIGWAGSLGSLGNALLSLRLGGLPAPTGFLLGQVGVGLFAAFIWLGAGLPWYLAGYFLLGGYRVTRTLAIAQVRELVHHANMGLAFGIAETVSASANLLASPLAGYLYAMNPEIVYPLALGSIAISILLSARFAPGQPQATNG